MSITNDLARLGRKRQLTLERLQVPLRDNAPEGRPVHFAVALRQPLSHAIRKPLQPVHPFQKLWVPQDEEELFPQRSDRISPKEQCVADHRGADRRPPSKTQRPARDESRLSKVDANFRSQVSHSLKRRSQRPFKIPLHLSLFLRQPLDSEQIRDITWNHQQITNPHLQGMRQPNERSDSARPGRKERRDALNEGTKSLGDITQSQPLRLANFSKPGGKLRKVWLAHRLR